MIKLKFVVGLLGISKNRNLSHYYVEGRKLTSEALKWIGGDLSLAWPSEADYLMTMHSKQDACIYFPCSEGEVSTCLLWGPPVQIILQPVCHFICQVSDVSSQGHPFWLWGERGTVHCMRLSANSCFKCTAGWWEMLFLGANLNIKLLKWPLLWSFDGKIIFCLKVLWYLLYVSS